MDADKKILYNSASMRMVEAKALLLEKLGNSTFVQNGKPWEKDSYMIGLTALDADGKVTKTVLGKGNDWDAAFKAAGIEIPEKKVKVAKVAKVVAEPVKVAGKSGKSAVKADAAKAVKGKKMLIGQDAVNEFVAKHAKKSGEPVVMGGGPKL